MRRALFAFPERAPEEKFRVFATNEVGALPLGDGGAGLLDLTGADCPWLGDDPASFWVEGRVHGASANLATEVSLDGSVIGRDAIRIRVAPFLVLSNCDVAEKLFYANLGTPDWEAFALDVTNAVSVFLPAVETPHTPFPQDVAELGWGGIETNGNPVVWSMERNGFKELLANDVGVFWNPFPSHRTMSFRSPSCTRLPVSQRPVFRKRTRAFPIQSTWLFSAKKTELVESLCRILWPNRS